MSHPIYSNPAYLRTLLQAKRQMEEEPRPQATVASTIRGVIEVGGLFILAWLLVFGIPWLFIRLVRWM